LACARPERRDRQPGGSFKHRSPREPARGHFEPFHVAYFFEPPRAPVVQPSFSSGVLCCALARRLGPRMMPQTAIAQIVRRSAGNPGAGMLALYAARLSDLRLGYFLKVD